MAKQSKKEPVNKGIGWLKIVMIITAAVLFFCVGFVAAIAYHRWTRPTDPYPLTIVIYQYDTKHSDNSSSETARPIYHTTYYEFAEPFTVNLFNSQRLLQAKVAVSTTYDASMMDAVVAHQLAIRSDILAVLATCTISDIQSDEGKRILQSKIRDAVNGVLAKTHAWPGIEAAHLTSIYVQ